MLAQQSSDLHAGIPVSNKGELARLSRGASRTLVVSTPRSGWFTCAGERGPGIAVWLHLARWAAANLKTVDLEFLATSGHEYENVGGATYLRAMAPKPDRVALWLHLGANVAARDWHELAQLVPLPGADSQRLLMVSEPLMPVAQRLFAASAVPGDDVARGDQHARRAIAALQAMVSMEALAQRREDGIFCERL